MGLTKVTVKISGFQEEKASYEALFLVDTGATDSIAPGDELEKIGVPKQSKMAYELADGTVKEYSFGIVKIEFMGEITAGRIIFGNKDIEPILGVTAFKSCPASSTGTLLQTGNAQIALPRTLERNAICSISQHSTRSMTEPRFSS